MIIQKEVRDLIKKIAAERDLPYTTVHDIIMSEFKFLRDEMGKGTKNDHGSFKTVLLRRLGTFVASEGKIKHMSERFAKKNAKDY